MSLLYNSFKIFSHQVVKVRPLLPHTTHLFQDNCFLMVSLYKCLLLGKKAVHYCDNLEVSQNYPLTTNPPPCFNKCLLWLCCGGKIKRVI